MNKMNLLQKTQRLLCVLAGAMALNSCYYDNEETLYPDSANCVAPLSPAFTADVLPILNLHCNNCHSGASASGGIRLDTYANTMVYVNDGSLLGSVQHQSGFSAMPKNSAKLPACKIQTIENWIKTGSPDN